MAKFRYAQLQEYGEPAKRTVEAERFVILEGTANAYFYADDTMVHFAKNVEYVKKVKD
ncbi:hypothetical protein [Nocardia nova]|uniref:hypothetical protein n=1 Tax=Nocardia nova TaxID=37330 RepID=UPI0027389BD9|nr:hypothetical protein [Nocardia nova]